jgi:site-specific DNA-cytosine methylase
MGARVSGAVYTALFPFCGLGAGALGFQAARAELFGREARVVSLGGIDLDADACRDFEALTGTKALCADVSTLTAAELRAAFGEKAPDLVFSSPPCTGFSGLLSETKSKTAHYQGLNRLVLAWVELMFAAWPEGPRLFLIENVPRIQTRGKKLLDEVKRAVRARGYVFHTGTHDCGELGNLAQHRSRFLLIARNTKRAPALVYEPPRLRVRGIGEVLAELPLPGDPAAGPLHALPRLSLLNWIRLSLIPPGGDWRDLPKPEERTPFNNVFRVLRWNETAQAVTSGATPTAGGQCVGDVRIEAKGHPHTYGVLSWAAPAHTVTGTMNSPGTGPCSVADPRIAPAADYHAGTYGVGAWGAPSTTVTGQAHVSTGTFSVADPRLGCSPRNGAYGVTSWRSPSCTVTGALQVDNGPAAVADPRVPGSPALRLRFVPVDLRSAPPFAPVLPTRDGSWHRPLTTLELAALQGLPLRLADGAPLRLAGKSIGEHRKRIGNAVPVPTARAIATQMLLSLLAGDAQGFSLSGEGSVWV